MGMNEKVFEGGLLEVYDNIERAIDSEWIEYRERLREELIDLRGYIGEKLEGKEQAIKRGEEKKYVERLLREFFKNAQGIISPRFYIFMVGSEIDSLISLLEYRNRYSKELRYKEIVDLDVTIREIDIINKAYNLEIENLVQKTMYVELRKWLNDVGLGKNKVVVESTVNVYKTIMYGHSLGFIQNMEEYEKQWVRSMGFNGNIDDENVEDIIRLAGKVVQFIEGGRRNTPKEEGKLIERFERFLGEKEWVSEEGLNIPIRTYSLDGNNRQVYLIGNRYEIVIRKRFVVHRYEQEMLQRTRSGVVIYSNSVHDMRVRDLERVMESIYFDVTNRRLSR